ncbi:MAG: peptidoglycan editing factor PgeF [Candidatus Melainabacteria bacterium]|nr:peptidoglycan editing factor PgeF [Candidatus Melainabacteria bacterium]
MSKTHTPAYDALSKKEWPIKVIGGLTVTFSPVLLEIPGLTHAFTTRLGGSSEAPLDSFNLGRHWPDDASRQDATANRARLCSVLGLNFGHLVVPGQVHSTNISWVSQPENLPDVDGIATVTPDMPVLLHYADCVPIILFDTYTKALAVLHAGWRGTAGGIATKAVRLISQVLNTTAEHMLAAIGPAIGSCCYPTSLEISNQLVASVNQPDGLIAWHNNRPHPDLKALNAMQLIEAGLPKVDIASYCTACQSELFYSHRQSKGLTGRQGAIASLNAIV